MNPFDITAIVILGYSLIRGFFRGFIKELASIVGVIGGYYAGNLYYQEVAQFLSRWIAAPEYLSIIGFLIIFCSVLIAVSILAVIIKYLLSIAFLGWIDRFFGLCFGTAKGVLIVAVLFFLFTTFLPRSAPVMRDSHLAPYVKVVAENMTRIIPEKMKQEFVKHLEQLKDAWKIQ